MSQGRIRKGVESSIRAAVSSGRLDLERDAAPLAMLRYMADFLDNDDGETPATRYVTPASFMTYCETLGFVPGVKPERKAEGDGKKTLTVIGNSKWTKRKASDA